MIKILTMLISCLILAACDTLPSSYQRNKFEEKMPKPIFGCWNIGDIPTEVSVSADEIGNYDYEGCDFSFTGMRPVQQISSREFLAYLCGMLGCSPSEIYHVKFPYPIQQLGTDSYYKFPDDICMSSEGIRHYTYTTQTGLRNTIASINLVKVKIASTNKRKQMLENLKTKKLKQAQKEWEEQNEKKNMCTNVASSILEIWENNSNARTFCEKIKELRACRLPYGAWKEECFWKGLSSYEYEAFENYYQNNCVKRN